MKYSRTPIYRTPIYRNPDLPGGFLSPDFFCENCRSLAEVSWYRILVKSRICGSDMLYPDIPGTPIYRAKWLPPRIPVNRGPTVYELTFFLERFYFILL
eukprot:sb/3478698/